LRAMFGVALVLSFAAGACGDDSGGDATSSTGSTAGATAAATTTTAKTLTPVAGGSLTIGLFSEIKGLDPLVSNGAANTGGFELGALYDRLVQWNPQTRTYDMRTAESLTANADSTEWTLKLKPNIKFTDGTPYDATAVKVNIERQQKENTVLRGPLAFIKDTAVVDPLTVKFTLTEAWGAFPFLLSNTPGMLVSPTALQKLGKDLPTNPVGAGAGPFIFDSFKSKEAIVLKKNPNYWGGSVYLDELRFIVTADANQALQSLQSGTVQVAYMRDPGPVAQSKTAGYEGYEVLNFLGEVLLVNQGVEVACKDQAPAPLCTGKADGAKIATKTPASDVRVRKAILLAIDPSVIDQRANNGAGRPGSSLFQTGFPWDPKVAGPKADVEGAKKLVTEAKAAGWDGKIRLTCNNTPSRLATALVVKTQLEAVGIEVNVKNDQDVQGVIADVITKKDFDLACWGTNTTPDDYAQIQIDSFLRSTSAGNRVGYKSAAMDAALNALKAAKTDDAKTAAYKQIAELWNTDAVSSVLSAVVERTAWSTKVHGIVGTSIAAVTFDKAWIEK